MKFKLIIFCIIVFGFYSCSPVRNSTIRNSKSKDSQPKTEIVEEVKPRFIDTTFINLPDVAPSKINIANEFTDTFNEAIKLFDEKNYDEACPKFSSILNTIDDSDSLYFEADFYVTECMVIKNKLPEAKKNLEMMLSDIRLPDNILEKVLVRLGQINCALNDKKSAASYFARLENINPNSIYLRVANCDFLKPESKKSK